MNKILLTYLLAFICYTYSEQSNDFENFIFQLTEGCEYGDELSSIKKRLDKKLRIIEEYDITFFIIKGKHLEMNYDCYFDFDKITKKLNFLNINFTLEDNRNNRKYLENRNSLIKNIIKRIGSRGQKFIKHHITGDKLAFHAWELDKFNVYLQYNIKHFFSTSSVGITDRVVLNIVNKNESEMYRKGLTKFSNNGKKYFLD